MTKFTSRFALLAIVASLSLTACATTSEPGAPDASTDAPGTTTPEEVTPEPAE